MRISLVLFILSIFQTFALDSFSQQQSVSLNMRESSLEDVLQELEKQTNFNFIYSANSLDLNRTVSISVKDKNVENVLKELFKGTSVKYVFYDNQVILTKGSETTKVTMLQKMNVTGVVTDTDGEPLPGVSVIVKGTTIGVTTDFDGKYVLEVPADAEVLMFTFVGMRMQEIVLNGQSTINVTMEEDAIGLEEVVAIGYGVQKKSTLTGAVSNVKAEAIEKIPVSNVSAALYGRMAGVNINSWTGTPGVSADITIRANSSLNGGSPIYVIDGIVRDKQAFDNLDPSELEEISILKDAAAAAVYGSRSANGAVVVTTKKGKTGAPVITFTSTYSKEGETKLPEMMDNAVEINEFFNDIIGDNHGHWAYWSQEELDWLATQNGGKGWNWFDEVKDNPHDQRHAINVSGGTKKVRYFISGSFYDQEGIIKELNYKKYNLRAKVEVDVSSDLTVGLQLANINTERKKYNFQYDYGNDGLPDVFSKLYLYNWDSPAYIDGKPTNVGWVGNPIEHMRNSGTWKKKSTSQEAIINAKYKVPGIKGLTAGVTYSRNVGNSLTKSFWRKHTLYNFKKEGDRGKIWTNEVVSTSLSSSPGRESLSNTHSQSEDYQLNFSLQYDRKFNEHHINALAIYEQAESEGSWFYGTRYDFPLIIKDQWFASSSAAEDSRVNGSEGEAGRLSYIGRLDYNYKEKYLFSASVRRDGSMIFAPGKRWGWFPAVSAGWRISEEPFFQNNVRFIDYLKLRGSYGLLGDDGVKPYQWQETYSATGGFLFGDDNSIKPTPGAKYDGLPNPNITWEESHSTNLGFDAAFLNKKLNVVGDLWFRRNTDILNSRIVSLPSTFGASMPDENYAEVKSHGYEFEVRYNDKIAGQVNYYVGANISYSTNEVVKKDVAENVPDYKNPIGRSLDYMYTVKYTDIIRTQEQLDALPEDYRIFGFKPELGVMNFEDISGPDGKPDNKIDGYDNQVVAKRSVAPYNAGLALGADWKGFTFDILFQSAFGHKKMYNGRGRECYPGVRPAAHWRDAWSEENPDGAYPKAVDWHGHAGFKNSTFWVRDGSYIRLKNLNLGYNLPKHWTKNIAGIDKIQLYMNATNLFVISKFTKEGWYDPELPSAEYYPNMKKITFGINVTL